MGLEKKLANIEGCSAWGITGQYEQRGYNFTREMLKMSTFSRQGESYAVFVMEDWRTPFMEYLAQGILPTNRTLAHQLKKLVIRYFL